MKDILSTSREEYDWLEKGYDKIKRIFSIETNVDLIIRRGISIGENKKRIDIAPLNFGEILNVSKYHGANSDWTLVGSGREEWRIEGPECNYTIHQKASRTLTNLV
ncbi:MAG: hypothetical protein AABW47_05060 [Nanoarchaeota archaeon]